MLVDLFTWLDRTLSAAPLMALTGAWLWGVLSILLSPCHLAGIPLIIGVIHGQGKITTGRAFSLALLFSIGLLLTLVLLGILTGFLGRIAGDVGPWVKFPVAGVLVMVGLYFLDLIPLPFLDRVAGPNVPGTGLVSAFFLGLIFGAALGPCSFAFMAPVLGVAFRLASTHMVFAAWLVGVYALGHISIIILAGTFMQLVQRYLDWSERSRGPLVVKKICGVLVLLGAVYLALA